MHMEQNEEYYKHGVDFGTYRGLAKALIAVSRSETIPEAINRIADLMEIADYD